MTGQTRFQAQTTYYQQLNEKPIDELEKQSPAEWQIGDVILDLYEITALLGEGGMGKVFRAHHRGWNLDLAVKCPKATVFASAQGKEDYIREAETWINLGLHPHIASCYYVRSLGGVPRLFAECVEGGSLENWIESRKLYEGGKEKALERMLNIAIQFAWGLGYAHEQGLVHQDVKPHNVLMTPEGVAKVTDFGLANSVGKTGTPAYRSPEQAARQVLTLKTDIWSWAVSILELFIGEVTWMGGEAAPYTLESYLEIGAEEVDIPSMPEALAQLLQRCFEENPALRPKDMGEIAKKVQQIYQHQSGKKYPREIPEAAKLRADSLNNKAMSMLDLGKKEEAENLLHEALEADAVHPEANFNWSLLQWRRGEIDDLVVVNRLEQILGALSDRWPTAYLLALVHVERGDPENALESLRDLEEYPEAQRLLAQARQQLPGAGLIKPFEGHKDWVHSVTISPNGRQGLSGSMDYTLKLWNLATGSCLRTFGRHAGFVNCVAFSPDGVRGLAGCNDGSLKLWDLTTGSCLRDFYGHNGSVESVTFNLDGRMALSGGSDGTLRLWDLATGTCVHIFKGHKGWVFSVAISPDGRFALSGSWDQTLRMWELASGACLRIFEGHEERVKSVAFSPDGRLALSGSLDNKLKLWEADTGNCLRNFEGNKYFVNSVAFSPDGHFALSGGYDKTLRLWNVSTGSCLRTFEGHKSEVRSVAFSPDGLNALSGADMTPRLWKVNGVGVYSAPYYLAMPTSGVQATEYERDFSEKIDEARIYLESQDYANALRLARQVRSLPDYERAELALNIWFALYTHCRPDRLQGGWQFNTLKGHEHFVRSVTFSPDGRHILSGSRDKTLKLWDLKTGNCLRTFAGHDGNVKSVTFSPDGRYALSGSSDQTMRLWNLATGVCMRTFKGHKFDVASVAFSPDGRLAVSGSGDKTLRLWDVATGVRLRTFLGHDRGVLSVVFSPDGRYVLSGSFDKTLRLWKVGTGGCLRTFEGSSWNVESVAFSPDGHFALSCSEKTVMLWEVESGECIRTFEGHTDWITSVAFSPNGRYAISSQGSDFRSEYILKLWEVETGKCLNTFEGHEKKINSVAFSPDGHLIVSGGDDMTLRMWALDWALQDYQPTDWDENARPYLEHFLSLHTSYAASLPIGRPPNKEEIRLSLTRRGKPVWTETDFQLLLYDLGCRGFGWLRPEGVRRILKEMAKQR